MNSILADFSRLWISKGNYDEAERQHYEKLAEAESKSTTPHTLKVHKRKSGGARKKRKEKAKEKMTAPTTAIVRAHNSTHADTEKKTEGEIAKTELVVPVTTKVRSQSRKPINAEKTTEGKKAKTKSDAPATAEVKSPSSKAEKKAKGKQAKNKSATPESGKVKGLQIKCDVSEKENYPKSKAESKEEGLTPYRGNRRAYGMYKCSKCKRNWHSGNSWADMGQECSQCNTKVYPYRQLPLKLRGKFYSSDKAHLQDLCEMCQVLGHNCNRIEKKTGGLKTGKR